MLLNRSLIIKMDCSQSTNKDDKKRNSSQNIKCSTMNPPLAPKNFRVSSHPTQSFGLKAQSLTFGHDSFSNSFELCEVPVLSKKLPYFHPQRGPHAKLPYPKLRVGVGNSEEIRVLHGNSGGVGNAITNYPQNINININVEPPISRESTSCNSVDYPRSKRALVKPKIKEMQARGDSNREFPFFRGIEYRNTRKKYYRGPGAITSFGFICIKKVDNIAKILLVRRQFTVEFSTFIIGRYTFKNLGYIRRLFRRMTFEEKKILQNESFYTIWNTIWYKPESKECLVQKYKMAYARYVKISNGVRNEKKQYIKLDRLINENRSQFDEPDWTLPKGKREQDESPLECAKREVMEETSLSPDQYNHLENIYPLYEKYKGSDGLLYKHVYYVSVAADDAKVKLDPNNKQQITEVGKIGWFTIQKALSMIRTNNNRKRDMFRRLKDILDTKYPEILEGVTYY